MRPLSRYDLYDAESKQEYQKRDLAFLDSFTTNSGGLALERPDNERTNVRPQIRL